MGFVDFHVMRGTHATLVNEIHHDPKLVAYQLRHTLDVNQNVYTRASLSDGRKRYVLESGVGWLWSIWEQTVEMGGR